MNTGGGIGGLSRQATMMGGGGGGGRKDSGGTAEFARGSMYYRNSVVSYGKMYEETDEGDGQIMNAQQLSKKIGALYRASMIGFFH